MSAAVSDTLAIAVEAVSVLSRYSGISPFFIKAFEVQTSGHDPHVFRVGNVETHLFAYITVEDCQRREVVAS